MKVEKFVELLGSEFYAGVPDSQLKALSSYLMDAYGLDHKHHVIAANEGNAAGLAAGYHLATGKTPVVYMQNSGEGNIVNPAASLLHEKVYAIPTIFVVGWRGEPGIHDEPQHIYQGEITLKLLETLGIRSYVIQKNSPEEEVREAMARFTEDLKENRPVAFVIGKNALEYEGKVKYGNENTILREEAVRHIVRYTKDDPIVSTTGKVSRELFEIREAEGTGHGFDFLTVGSMGHASSIALGIAMAKPEKTIWCLDGDGAVLMHMGALAITAQQDPAHFVHIVINNGAHESVGGMPTAALGLSIAEIAKASGYPYAVTVNDLETLDRELEKASQEKGLRMIEVRCSIASRSDLGRPTTTPVENKRSFMEHLNQ